jgi:hypothetical protein
MKVFDILEKMFERQEKIIEDLNEIKVIQAMQAESLKEHIRRTALAEENIELLRKELEPVEEHVDNVRFLLKVGYWFVGFVVSIFTIIQIINSLN